MAALGLGLAIMEVSGMHTTERGIQYPGAELARRGIIGGLVGGIAMAMLMMIVTAVQGMGFLRPLYLIAALFNQQWAMVQGLDVVPVLIGAMVHMVNSAVFGLMFALLLGLIARGSRLDVWGWALAGTVWGVVLFVVNQYAVLPIVDPAMAQGAGGVLLWWIVSHLMFGVVLGAIVASPFGLGVGA